MCPRLVTNFSHRMLVTELIKSHLSRGSDKVIMPMGCCDNAWATLCQTLLHSATLPHSAALYHTLPHSAALCRTLLHSAALCRTLPHSAALCRTLPHSAALCCTPSHSVALCNSTAFSRTQLHYSVLCSTSNKMKGLNQHKQNLLHTILTALLNYWFVSV